MLPPPPRPASTLPADGDAAVRGTNDDASASKLCVCAAPMRVAPRTSPSPAPPTQVVCAARVLARRLPALLRAATAAPGAGHPPRCVATLLSGVTRRHSRDSHSASAGYFARVTAMRQLLLRFLAAGVTPDEQPPAKQVRRVPGRPL